MQEMAGLTMRQSCRSGREKAHAANEGRERPTRLGAGVCEGLTLWVKIRRDLVLGPVAKRACFLLIVAVGGLAGPSIPDEKETGGSTTSN